MKKKKIKKIQIKKFILNTLNELFNESILDDQVKWEYLKYNVRKYAIKFSKRLAENTNKILLTQKQNISILKNMKIMLTAQIIKSVSNNQMKSTEKKAKGIKIRSKCNQYEHGEKSTKFFLILEKHRAIQSQIYIRSYIRR